MATSATFLAPSFWRSIKAVFERITHGGPTDEWHHVFKYFEVSLMDGTIASGHLMHRKMGDDWVYRRETAEEEDDRLKGEAI